jgi:hypothetical protein
MIQLPILSMNYLERYVLSFSLSLGLVLGLVLGLMRVRVRGRVRIFFCHDTVRVMVMVTNDIDELSGKAQ